MSFRDDQRSKAVDRRMLEYGRCLCDLCRKRPGAEYHEWVTRHSTIKQEEWRELSFQQEICSLLCHGCHQTKATTSEGKHILLEFNVRLYGKSRVVKSASMIPEQFWRNILPELYDMTRASNDLR